MGLARRCGFIIVTLTWLVSLSACKQERNLKTPVIKAPRLNGSGSGANDLSARLAPYGAECLSINGFEELKTTKTAFQVYVSNIEVSTKRPGEDLSEADDGTSESPELNLLRYYYVRSATGLARATIPPSNILTAEETKGLLAGHTDDPCGNATFMNGRAAFTVISASRTTLVLRNPTTDEYRVYRAGNAELTVNVYERRNTAFDCSGSEKSAPPHYLKRTFVISWRGNGGLQVERTFARLLNRAVARKSSEFQNRVKPGGKAGDVRSTFLQPNMSLTPATYDEFVKQIRSQELSKDCGNDTL